MSYARHAAVDLAVATGQVISSVPTTEDMIFTLRGRTTLGSVGSVLALRPNSDGGANYINRYWQATGGASATGPNINAVGLIIGQDTDAADHLSTYRIVKVGNFWHCYGTHWNLRDNGNTSAITHYGTRWASGGVALSSLQFRCDIQNAASRFTGRVELWYQNA